MQNTVNEITTKHNKWIATTIDKVKLLVYIQTKNTGNGKMNATNEQQNLLRKGHN